MKILQINCVYAVGSTGRILEDISKYCTSHKNEVLNLYGRRGKNITSNVIKVSSEIEAKIHSAMSLLTGLDFGWSPFATKNVISIIESYKPSVVHLHCLNGHFINVYRLLNYLKKNNIPTVLTLHAEIMHTAGCEHAYECKKWITGCYDCKNIKGYITRYFRDDAKYAYEKMREAFSGFTNLFVVGVSEWLTNRARQSSIFSNSNAEFLTIENGLDLKDFHPIDLNDNPLGKSNNIKEKAIILHVTPNFNHPLKGGKYVLELAKIHPEWTFYIVGYNGDEILPQNVITIPNTQNKKELSWYYNIANVTLLTSKRETFSMVCAESLACGTPIVGFEAGGPESVFKGEYVKFTEFGNINALDAAVSKMLDNKTKINTTLIHKRFGSDIMAEKYLNLYRSIVSR